MFFFLINCVLKIWNNGKLVGGGGIWVMESWNWIMGEFVLKIRESWMSMNL